MKKKIFAIAIALMMLVIYSAAFAWTITIEENDKITVSIKPMDIYTGEILDAKPMLRILNSVCRLKLMYLRALMFVIVS